MTCIRIIRITKNSQALLEKNINQIGIASFYIMIRPSSVTLLIGQ